MARTTDILFMTEYIKNVLYFATVRQGKVLKNTNNTHYFTIDEELVYENYYSDFGPLNLGCVYKYCKILNEKLQFYLKKQYIVHYTSIDPKKKANAAFLLGCFGVLYLSLTPKDALKPLMIHGQSYKPFQDATHGDSIYTVTLMDCLQGLAKARDLRLFNFQDFNYEEYVRLDKIQGGDLNWIVPGKFLAFIGPVDYHVTLYHPPEMYIEYFLENNVKTVIRLNKRLYDGNVFTNVGITHYNLFFPDGSCPPRHILLKFLQISEESDGAIAVHCKAGLGRTGSLIGCYLIKHYRMTAHEAIAWMRICRPGSVIGHQQAWLEELESWLIKQGNLYRRRTYQDIDKLPVHQYGIYSFVEKSHKFQPVVISKSPSPPPPLQRLNHSEISNQIRPQASKIREEKSELKEDDLFLAPYDLTIDSKEPTGQTNYIIKNSRTSEEHNSSEESDVSISLWKKCFHCKTCKKFFCDKLWWLAVRCAKMTPKRCHINKCCILFDKVAPCKAIENKSICRNDKTNDAQTDLQRRNSPEISRLRRGSGESRNLQSSSRCNTPRSQTRSNVNSNKDNGKNVGYIHNSTFRTNQTIPIARTLNDAKSLLIRSTIYNKEMDKRLSSSVTVKPHYIFQDSNNFVKRITPANIKTVPSVFSSGLKDTIQPQHRRRLGRSPSPPPLRNKEQSRATNTPQQSEIHSKDSKSALRAALSRLQLSGPRDGSIGAASLGARRDAPPERRAPSVRSDERPLATQGDMLNSIKFQRRLRELLATETHGKNLDKSSTNSKDKSSVRNVSSRTSTSTRPGVNRDVREKSSKNPPRAFTRARPSSPKGRRSPHPAFY